MPDNIRYVTHVDILGMSSLVQRNAEQAWEVLSGLASVRDHLDSFGVEVTASGQKFAISDRVFRVMFSDTIVLFTKGETEDDLRLLLIATGELFHKAMFNGIPVRVGVALGKFFFNFEKSMFAGPALIDAYHLGESAQWLGISTSETVYLRSKAVNFRSGSLADAVIPAMIPVTKRYP
ncbi:MAG TPA: hypothetical protein DDZ88_10405 [Verrucomicrobiales bacterium]|nr:hypothetical protein [Verrucomicrobiales bacterium]